jgi:hypothetical protein
MAIPLRLTQGDEKRLLSSNRPPGKRRPSLCHPERTRDRRSESSDIESSAISRPESQRSVWLTFPRNSRRRNPGLT